MSRTTRLVTAGLLTLSALSPTVALADEAPVVAPQSSVVHKDEQKKTDIRSIVDMLKKKIDDTIKGKVVAPTTGAFTSPFAMRWGVMHNGIDIANSLGTPIVSITDGVVIDAGPAAGYGHWVRIRNDDGVIFTYGHMPSVAVREGQVVKAGEYLAPMGNEGFSTGPHLHLGVELGEGNFVDPLQWLREHGITDW